MLEQALAIGEGILLNTDSTEEEDYYITEEGYKHKFNSFEKVMDVFGGRGSVQLSRAD